MMRKLKNWFSFINESVDDNWKIDKEDINEWLLDFKDADYSIDVEQGYIRTAHNGYFDYSKGKWISEESEVFTENLVLGKNWRSYQITIKYDKGSDPTDLTDSFKFLVEMLHSEGDFDIHIVDDEGADYYDDFRNALDHIKIKKGTFMGKDELDSIVIFVKEKESFNVNPIELAEFFNWKVQEKDDKTVYAVFEMSQILVYFLTDNYCREILEKGSDSLYDRYDSFDYRPELYSLVNYTFDKEMSKDVLDILLDDELEKVRIFVSEEYDEEFETKDELITFLISKDRYTNEVINEFYKDHELIDELKRTCGELESQAHAEKNWEELIDDFDDVVREEMSFTKEDKLTKKFYRTKDGQRHEYEEYATFYKFAFDERWISDNDERGLNDLHGNTLESVCEEWMSSNDSFSRSTLEPRFSDYGNVDTKELRGELKGIIKSFKK